MVARRHINNHSFSSPGSATYSDSSSGGNISLKVIFRAPACQNSSIKSGKLFSSRLLIAARKACGCRNCAAPRRFHWKKASSTSPAGGGASLSTSVTGWPFFASARPVHKPVIPAPTMTTDSFIKLAPKISKSPY